MHTYTTCECVCTSVRVCVCVGLCLCVTCSAPGWETRPPPAPCVSGAIPGTGAAARCPRARRGRATPGSESVGRSAAQRWPSVAGGETHPVTLKSHSGASRNVSALLRDIRSRLVILVVPEYSQILLYLLAGQLLQCTGCDRCSVCGCSLLICMSFQVVSIFQRSLSGFSGLYTSVQSVCATRVTARWKHKR